MKTNPRLLALAAVGALLLAGLLFFIVDERDRAASAAREAPVERPRPSRDRPQLAEPGRPARGADAPSTSADDPDAPGAGEPSRARDSIGDVGERRAPPADVEERIAALAQVAARFRAEAREPARATTTRAPDKEGIRAAMRDAIPKLKECYEPWAAMNPELSGKISASFVLGPDGGTPDDVHVVEGGLGSEALDGCILSVVESELHFARTADGEPVRVTYPLRFSSEPDPAQ